MYIDKRVNVCIKNVEADYNFENIERSILNNTLDRL